MSRPLYVIHDDIKKNWVKVWFGAVPYLNAMRYLNTIDDMYGYDAADSIVRYLLSNAQTWKANDARRIKAELKSMLDRKG